MPPRRTDSEGNAMLAAALRQTRLTNKQVAQLITETANAMGYTQVSVHGGRVSDWVLHNVLPRFPAGDILAAIVTEKLGFDVSAADLGVAPPHTVDLPADHGLRVPWDEAGLHRVLENGRIMMSRRDFVVVSGAALTAPAWHALGSPPVIGSTESGNDQAGRPQAELDLVDEIVAQAQQLDERYGTGGADFVDHNYRVVDSIRRANRHNAAGQRRLLIALAQLSQTLGFMYHDGLQNGRAQRCYFYAQRLAQAAGDHGLLASVMALQSNQAIDLGHLQDAGELAAISQHTARKAPPLVRALISARAGLAAAAVGDLTDFERSRDDAQRHLDLVTGDPEAPRWASYVTRIELDALAGRGLVALADRIPARRSRLLAAAEPLLRPRAATDTVSPAQRSALRHGTLLALAYIHDDDLDQAATATHTALSRLTNVTSARLLAQLDQLGGELAHHTGRSASVQSAHTELQRGLATAASTRRIGTLRDT